MSKSRAEWRGERLEAEEASVRAFRGSSRSPCDRIEYDAARIFCSFTCADPKRMQLTAVPASFIKLMYKLANTVMYSYSVFLVQFLNFLIMASTPTPNDAVYALKRL